MVYSESTRHYWCTLRKFRESCEIHPPLADLHNLLLALALASQVGRLPWNDFLGWGQFLTKCDELPQLKQWLLLFLWLNCGKFGLGLNCCWGCGTGGQLNLGCWGGLAIHLPGDPSSWWIISGRGSCSCVFWTNRYLGGWTLEGPVGIFHFFSALWVEIQSS
jgi:hypothetical protein